MNQPPKTDDPWLKAKLNWSAKKQRKYARVLRDLANQLEIAAEKKSRRKQTNLPALEPELEAISGHLCPVERIWMARKLEWWSRQLRATAEGMAGPPDTRPQLTYLDRAGLARN